MPAGAATDPSETPGEDAAADEAIELALHQLRHGLSSTCDGGRERRAMMPDRPMQWRALDVARAVARRQRRAGLGAAQKPAVAARQWRRRDRVHPGTAVSTRTFVHGSHGSCGTSPPSGRQAAALPRRPRRRHRRLERRPPLRRRCRRPRQTCKQRRPRPESTHPAIWLTVGGVSWPTARGAPARS
jgi:hypothetical protein